MVKKRLQNFITAESRANSLESSSNSQELVTKSLESSSNSQELGTNSLESSANSQELVTNPTNNQNS